MSQAPMMPIFTDALLGDTLHLSTEEFGAYLLLLFATWRNNGVALPDKPGAMAHICRCPVVRWKRVLRPVLVKFFTLDQAGCWHQKRLETEWVSVENRRAKSKINGTRGGRPKQRKTKETPKATGSDPVTDPVKRNESGSKALLIQVERKDLALKKLNPDLSTTRESSPPLPSRGDGVAASRPPDSPANDLVPSAEAAAELGRALLTLRSKMGLLDSDATVLPLPDPRLIAFRDRKQRVNTAVGERLRGEERVRGWEVIARVDEFLDPDAIPPPLLAELAALESLVMQAEAAE